MNMILRIKRIKIDTAFCHPLVQVQRINQSILNEKKMVFVLCYYLNSIIKFINLRSMVGWIRRASCVVIHQNLRKTVDYDAKGASNPPYKCNNFNLVLATH